MYALTSKPTAMEASRSNLKAVGGFGKVVSSSRIPNCGTLCVPRILLLYVCMFSGPEIRPLRLNSSVAATWNFASAMIPASSCNPTWMGTLPMETPKQRKQRLDVVISGHCHSLPNVALATTETPTSISRVPHDHVSWNGLIWPVRAMMCTSAEPLT